MKINTYKCDECGIQKQESNHWFQAYRLAGTKGIIVTEWDNALWENERINQTTVASDEPAHLCGAACVSKWVSENLL